MNVWIFLSFWVLSGHVLSWLLFLPIETRSDDQVFSIYLGNIPADVILEEVQINGMQLMMSESAERGYSISPVVNINGSRAYELRLPFVDDVVHWMVSAPHRTCILLTCFGSFSNCCLLGSSMLWCDIMSAWPIRINSTVTTLQSTKVNLVLVTRQRTVETKAESMTMEIILFFTWLCPSAEH